MLSSFFIFLLCILPNSIYADKNMNFENLTIDNGLSQATAEAIIQDSDGYVWIGTNDGLNRYNGSEIKVFDSNDEDENIYSITKDKYDNLWIGTNQGLHKVDSKSTRAYPYSVGNTKTSEWGKVRSIFFDDDNMWVGTAENGLKRVDLKNNKFKSFEVDEKDNNKLQSLTVRDIIKDSSGDIWIATEKGISEFIKI